MLETRGASPACSKSVVFLGSRSSCSAPVLEKCLIPGYSYFSLLTVLESG